MSTQLFTPPSATTSAAAAAAVPDAPRRIRVRARELGLRPVVKRCRLSGVSTNPKGTETDEEEAETAEETAARVKAKADTKKRLAKRTAETLSQFSGILSVFFGQWFHKTPFSDEACMHIAEYARVVHPRFSPDLHGLVSIPGPWSDDRYGVSSVALEEEGRLARVAFTGLLETFEGQLIDFPAHLGCHVVLHAPIGILPECWTLRVLMHRDLSNLTATDTLTFGTFHANIRWCEPGASAAYIALNDVSDQCQIVLGGCAISVVDFQFNRLSPEANFSDSPYTPYKIVVTITEAELSHSASQNLYGNIADWETMILSSPRFTGSMQLFDDTGSSWC